MSWTEDRTTSLKKLWLDGLSASQIAKQLGGVSRNAVIGKVHRLGLSGRAMPSRPARLAFKAPRAPATTMPSAPRRVIAAEPTSIPIVAQQPPVPQLRVEELRPTVVLSPGRHMCKWPIGDPTSDGFGFCGRIAASDKAAYCTDHAGLAYKAKPPRDKTVSGNRKLPLWARS